MKNLNKFFEELYKNFNERKIELVIEHMTTNVKWANGMEGGYVYGHEGVKEYWARQFAMISSMVTPLIIKTANGQVIIDVRQVVHDLEGNLLNDEITEHVFYLLDDKISEFNILKKS